VAVVLLIAGAFCFSVRAGAGVALAINLKSDDGALSLFLLIQATR